MLALSFAMVAVGFLLPLWPLALVGVAIAALSGQWIFTLMLGLLLDVAFGAPVGKLHVLYFPFALFALAGIVVRYMSSSYIRQSSRDTL